MVPFNCPYGVLMVSLWCRVPVTENDAVKGTCEG